MASRLFRISLIFILPLVVGLGSAGTPNSNVRAQVAQPADFDIPNGHFYTQAGGGAGGFAITDNDGILLWSEFQRLGGVAALGYPISSRFVWDGFTVQATQRVIMQWRPEVQQVYFVNVFDRLSDLGFDNYLFTVRQTPFPLDTSGDTGKTFEQVARERRQLLRADPAIEAAYFGVIGDPLLFNGLPTSPVTDMGNHFALRAQRVVIQHWKEDVPWARAGDVTFALGGDIAKEVVALPDRTALAPRPGPGLPPVAVPAPTPPVVVPAPTAPPVPTSVPTAVATLAPSPGGADRYGMNLGVRPTDPRQPQLLDLTQQASIGWVRQFIYWAEVERQKGRFDWQMFDPVITQARAEGLQVLGVLGFATDWNTTAPPSVVRAANRHRYPPTDYGAWDNYVFQTVSRYKDRIKYWEVWNEPDAQSFWPGTPAEFTHLMAVAYGAVKRADPSAQVLMAGLAMGGAPGRWDPDFFGKILADPTNPAARYFDVANVHHYGPKAEADRRLNYMRGEMARFGAGNRPIWVTEVGYGTDPSLQHERQYQGLNGQAQWLQDMLPHLLSQGVAKVFWYNLVDDAHGGREFTSHGLLEENLTQKPSFTTFRQLATSGG